MSVRYLCLIAFAASLGCATTSGTTSARRNSNVITEQEVAAINVSTAYDAIQKLRPNFLRGRGQTSLSSTAPEYPNVYVDGQRYGDISSLHNITAIQVREIRYYSVSEAATRFGMNNNSGVIEVKMK